MNDFRNYVFYALLLVLSFSVSCTHERERNDLVLRNAVKDVSVWFGNKLAINLTVETPEKVIVSKARVAEFKAWFVS